jgi:gas vesicle protein
MARHDDGSRFVWFLTGAALGAAIALLYAPQSGEQTRKLIGRKAREGRDVLADQGEELIDRGKELFERGRKVADEAAELFERGRKLVEG